MNRKNKTNNKKIEKKQKNSIDNYFGKRLNAVYLERLQEEIQDCMVSNAKSDSETQKGSTEEIVEKQPNQISQDDWIALNQRIEYLEKRCKELETKNSKLMNDNCAMKKMLDAAKGVNVFKDIKIQQLKSQLIAGAPAAVNKNTTSEKTSKTIQFSAHEQHFSAAELNELRSIGKGKRQDAIFVARCLEFLYKHDVEKLTTKCAGDRKSKGKSTITPSKKVLMSTLLGERVESEGVDDQAVFDRCQRVTRLIGDGIFTLTKRAGEIKTNPASTITSTITSQVPVQVRVPAQQVPISQVNRTQMIVPQNYVDA